MKKILLLLTLTLICLTSYGQYKAKYIFCEIVGSVSNISKQIEITIDYGDNSDATEKSILVDDNGDPIKFKSMVDALNFMGMHGWEFVQTYAISHTNSKVYHFLMKKPFEELDPKIQKLYVWDDKKK